VATYKTAYYSYMLPLQVGSALAGAPLEELDNYREYSLYAGFGFQMQDDIIGIFGDESTTGKSRKSDIVEGKKTLLMADALSHTNAAGRDVLQSALGNTKLATSTLINA
jgi:geranylgeranyl diphosphate synthase type I